jgi:hypothetical protein
MGFWWASSQCCATVEGACAAVGSRPVPSSDSKWILSSLRVSMKAENRWIVVGPWDKSEWG